MQHKGHQYWLTEAVLWGLAFVFLVASAIYAWIVLPVVLILRALGR